MAKTRPRKSTKKGTNGSASLTSDRRTSADSNERSAPGTKRSTRVPWPSGPERLSEAWGRVASEEIVGRPVLAEGGLEVRPKRVKVLARFSDQDHPEFDGRYSRVSHWARLHDKSGVLNDVAPDLDQLEKQCALVDAWFRRVRGYKP